MQNILTAKNILQILKRFEPMLDTSLLKARYSIMKDAMTSLNAAEKENKEYISRKLSEFILDFYVVKSIGIMQDLLSGFIEKKSIHTSEEFEAFYLKSDEKEMRNLMLMKDSQLKKLDDEFNHALRNAVLDSGEVQRMDGKSEYVIRRLLRAYKSNPQQLPDQSICRIIKNELKHSLPEEVYINICKFLTNKLKYSCESDKIKEWEPYQCRNALRVLQEESELEKIIFPVMMRVIFDYVGMMTDTFAWAEYKQLYG